MTGPGPGKIRLTDAKLYLVTDKGRLLLTDGEIYIHLKGYSYARVTHLDLEHPILNELIKPSEGGYYKIFNYDSRIKILAPWYNRVLIDDSEYKVYAVEAEHEYFRNLIRGGYLVTWVGGKSGGIYIGFKKEQIRKLEEIGRIYGYEV